MKRATSFDADNRWQSSVPTIHDSFAYGEYQTPAGLGGAAEAAPGGGTGDE